MVSTPCSIHIDLSSAAAAATWSRPSCRPLELASAGRLRIPFPGPTKTLGRPRDSSGARTEVGLGGGVRGACGWLRSRSGGVDARGTGIYGGQRWRDFGSDAVEQLKLQSTSRFMVRHRQSSKEMEFSGKNLNLSVFPVVLSPMLNVWTNIRWSRTFSATSGSEIAPEDIPPLSTDTRGGTSPTKVESVNTEKPLNDTQLSSLDVQPTTTKADRTTPDTQEGATKRPPLTAREKLRAARVLSKYTESRPSRSELGSRVLDAIRETDGGKKRSGLPEAPSNLFDDSKRGLPKQGFTFNFPVGTDILVIAFSFVFISTVMFATTYIVWKAGAIHFNEY